MNIAICLTVQMHVFTTMHFIFTNLFVHVTLGCGSFLQWWHSDAVWTCAFVDDITLAHTVPYSARNESVVQPCCYSFTMWNYVFLCQISNMANILLSQPTSVTEVTKCKAALYTHSIYMPPLAADGMACLSVRSRDELCKNG